MAAEDARLHPALEQLGKNKVTGETDGAQLEILIGPHIQTLLPPSWADGVQREWVLGDKLLPDEAARIPEEVLRRLGCDLVGSVPTCAEPAQLFTDSNPTSVISVRATRYRYLGD